MRIIANKEQAAERMPKWKKYIKYLWIAFGAVVLGVFLLFFFLSMGDLPSTENLEDKVPEAASQIYSDDGELLGRFYVENRVPVSYDELNKNVVEALIATEDERFFSHSGIDFRGLVRAVSYMGSKGGASTITQQLAKLYFTGRRSRKVSNAISQKLKEWIIAVRLERQYTKEEIIAKYLNKFDFLYSGHGIRAASETYFGKDQKDLSKVESAMLVGMLKNPSLYNPKKYPTRAAKRRDVVLKQMVRNDLLTKTEYDSLRTIPVDVSAFKRRDHNDGVATYFRVQLGKEVRNILSQKQYFDPSTGEMRDMYRDGLKIYTTINSKMQTIAEQQMVKHMQKLQGEFDKHWKNEDPWQYVDIDEDDFNPEKTRKKQLEIRAKTMERYIRRSERYEKIRDAYLSNLLEELVRKVKGLKTRDVDIERMLEEDKEKGQIKKMRRAGSFSKKMEAEYLTALKTEEWKNIKPQWFKFQKAIENNFAKPTKMRVFSYETESMEVDTVLSPKDSIIYHNNFLQLGSMAVDPNTGEVKTWVGGINHKYFQYDHVTSSRQVGSTFKPFIYATAIGLQGMSPCLEVLDQAYTIFPGEGTFSLLDEWTPKNSDNKYTGERLTLKEGLRKSKNTVSVYLMKQLGDTEPVRGLIHNMGIDSTKKYANGRYRVPKQPSIALGSTDLTVQEMTGAYTTFANNGVFTSPYFIAKIEDRNGGIIYEANPETRQAYNERHNYVMVEMLRYSGTGLYQLKSDVGGKTGTTNSHVDGWFMGITPNLVVGTWVGGEDRWIHFRSLRLGSGAHMAKPFFREFMKAVEADEELGFDSKTRFKRPEGDLGIELNCDEYKQEPGGTPNMPQDDDFDEDVFGDELLPVDTTKKKQVAEQGFSDELEF